MSASVGNEVSAWADATVGRLSMPEKLAQLLVFLPEMDAQRRPSAATARAVAMGAGTMHAEPLHDPADMTTVGLGLRRIALEEKGIPLIVAANLEQGVSYTVRDTGTDVPYQRGLGLADDADLAWRAGNLVARQARTLGIGWVFGPSLDVTTNPADPIIGIRAYGPDPELVARLGVAQINGIQDTGAAACAKHYPGHGDATADSHTSLPVISRDTATHAAHLRPFLAAAAAGVRSVMTAHICLPGTGIDAPATLDPLPWQELREAGYHGVVITDSLRMRAIADRYPLAEAAIRSLKAGCDVLNVKLSANQIPGLVSELTARVRDGEASEARVDAALYRFLTLKAAAAVRDNEPGSELSAMLSSGRRPWDDPGTGATARVVHDPHDLLPRPPRGHVLVIAQHAGSEVAQAISRRSGAAATVLAPDRQEPVDVAVAGLAAGDAVVLVASSTGPARDGDVALARRIAPLARSRGAACVAMVLGTPAEGYPNDWAVVIAPAVDAFSIVSLTGVASGVAGAFSPREASAAAGDPVLLT